MLGPFTTFEIPATAPLPRVSSVLRVHGQRRVGMPPRVGTDHQLHFVSRGRMVFTFPDAELVEVVVSAGQILHSAPTTIYGVNEVVSEDTQCFHCHFSIPGATVSQHQHRPWVPDPAHVDAVASRRNQHVLLPRLWRARRPQDLAGQFLDLMSEQRSRTPGNGVAAQARFLLLIRSITADAMAIGAGIHGRIRDLLTADDRRGSRAHGFTSTLRRLT